MRKVFEDTRREIILEYGEGYRLRQIAKRMGLSHEGVRKILRQNGVVLNHRGRRGRPPNVFYLGWEDIPMRAW